MWKLLDRVLNQFRNCFNRLATFKWFVVIVIGFMIRTDTLSVTSVIRDLAISPDSYINMMNFFRSGAWQLQSILNQWMKCVKDDAPVYKEDGMTILVGDGVKQSKEARKMPGVKRLHQESENSSKAEYIFGHLFGGIGVLAGDHKKLFCIPLSLKIHDGIKKIRSWDENENEGNLMHILTKAKMSCIAYTKPDLSKKAGRGRPRKKGDTIKLKELFTSSKETFKKTTLMLYGKMEEVEYLTLNFLWGKGYYRELRFVLVKYQGKNSILVSTKLDLDPMKMIELYAYRFKIECAFRELKQVLGAFSYQFWSKVMPKLNRYSKKDAKNPLENIQSPREKELILKTVKAIKGYVMMSIIAMGLLQILALKFSDDMTNSKFPIRYLRTKSRSIHSEVTVACFLRKSIFCIIEKNSRFTISKIIKSKRAEPLDYEDWLAS